MPVFRQRNDHHQRRRRQRGPAPAGRRPRNGRDTAGRDNSLRPPPHGLRKLHARQAAAHVLDVGGVVIGDVPSWRVDNMPYGGVKDSGLGREGVRYAIEDMTEIRMFVVKDPN